VCEAPSALLNLSGVPFPQPNATNATNATSPITRATPRATPRATNGTNGTNATIEDLDSAWAPSWAPSAYWPPLPLRASVEVSANGVDYSASADPFEFSYHEPLPYELAMPLPPLGPSRGGAILRLSGVPTILIAILLIAIILIAITLIATRYDPTTERRAHYMDCHYIDCHSIDCH
jgi:hypothetical protein